MKLLLFIMTIFTGAAMADDFATVTGNIGQVYQFVELLNSTDVIDMFSENGPYTIFAPNDEAFVNQSMPTNETELVRYSSQPIHLTSRICRRVSFDIIS
jgi:uncharacterized surface protein with fasciclin (FAS1) repeats